MSNLDNRIKCFYFGSKCMNNAVGEFDLGDGKGVKFYCRKCCEELELYIDEPDTFELDESLVFCQREWDEQKWAN